MICLDSWAVIAWVLGQEPSAAQVQKVISQRPLISTVNIAEVFYIVKRKSDEDTAQQLIRDLRSQLTFVTADEDLAVRAGLIKSNNPLALADAFALATSATRNATLLTGDPEILRLKGKWKVRDIR